ncbi:MAG TPA: 2OG-Fe(II) oxygenase [Candidatus Methylacidiphilales bacterium]|jgi:Rps23 Pro-64 3,4-dihydroxylase Tpa1-like proline 4-hydroxylase|nr:2OG-Fe(II) oxygenase [Candidatus Methylacidiphilales bacterium]
MIDLRALESSIATFADGQPFRHCVIDDFVSEEAARQLESEVLPYDSPKWYVYKNQIEDKKALNDWNIFPAETYKYFQCLNSPEFVAVLSKLTVTRLYADPGVHGGGWHAHGPGGNLNPHLDYSIHPKLGLQRKLNIILYISSELKPEHGGHLGLWEHDSATNRPGMLKREIEPRFGRAVLFDTTQNSWHGMSRPLTQPEGIYRKSLAAYFLCDPPQGADPRGRALFAPREEQKGDAAIEELIKARSGVTSSEKVYRT